jgi:hypothetical protein
VAVAQLLLPQPHWADQDRLHPLLGRLSPPSWTSASLFAAERVALVRFQKQLVRR